VTGDPLEFELPMTGNVTIDVVDAEGRSVRSLLFGDVSEYDGRIVWDATDDAGRRVAPGLYLATQRMEGREITRRIVIGR
jgi:flagellar hook assembly protein FlgD